MPLSQPGTLYCKSAVQMCRHDSETCICCSFESQSSAASPRFTVASAAQSSNSKNTIPTATTARRTIDADATGPEREYGSVATNKERERDRPNKKERKKRGRERAREG